MPTAENLIKEVLIVPPDSVLDVTEDAFIMFARKFGLSWVHDYSYNASSLELLSEIIIYLDADKKLVCRMSVEDIGTNGHTDMRTNAPADKRTSRHTDVRTTKS